MNQIKERAVSSVRKHRSPIGVCMLVVLILFIAGQIVAGPGSWPFVIGLFFLAIIVHFSKKHYTKTLLTFIVLTIFFVGFLYVKGVSASADDTVVTSVRVTPQPQVKAAPAEKSKAEKAAPKTKAVKTTCKELKKFDENIQQWCSLIKKYSAKYGVDPVLVASIIQIESGGNKDSISNQGAVGIMQVMPKDFFWNRPTREQLLIPKRNIDAGCEILSENIKAYGNIRDAVKHYGPMNYGYIYADDVLKIYNEKSS